MRLHFFYIYFILSCFSSFGQNTFTISGYVEDADSGEKLIAANVFDAKTYEGSITNNFGFFSVTLQEGVKEFTTSYIGYDNDIQIIDLKSDTSLLIRLSSEARLQEVVIIAEKQKNIAEESQMSTIDVPVKQIKNIPALLGEVDVLKALQLLPGVQSGGEGQSGLYIRGGSPDQNLILLDGVPVYNASHLFGFFSVFNADAIKDVKLIKGGYPARYGGRLSSVLEITMKDGNMKEFKGAGSIGLISSKLTLEGPIKKDQTSYIFSARRTYADLLAKPFIAKEFANNDKSGGSGIYFYDLNAKFNHVLSPSDKLYLSFYGGNDRFYFDEKDNTGDVRDFTETKLGWGNITTALRWNHLWNPKLFSNTTLTFSRYKLDTSAQFGTEFVDQDGQEEILLGYDSGIDDWAAKIDFDYLPNTNHFLRFGLSMINHTFKPGKFRLKDVRVDGDVVLDEVIGQDDVNGQEIDLYVEDDLKFSNKLKANLGVHLSGFFVNGETYTSAQPRVSMRYLISEDQSLKFSFSTMRQYIQLLSFDGIGLPTDLWVPTTDRVKPQDSWQVAAGYAFKLNEDWDVTVEGYYKEMTNLISYKEGDGLFALNDWQDRVTQGDGTSYGAEFFLQKKRGRFNGWIGYTLSWTDRQFDELNNGEPFPYRFDRRHDISVVAQYELGPKVSLSGAWVYGTGNAVSLPRSNYRTYFPEDFGNRYLQQIQDIPERNNFRMGAYHRLDFGINFSKKKRWGERTWSLGAYNIYNRKNPFFIDFSSEDEFNEDTGNTDRVRKLKQQALFPIIPYFSYNFKF